MEIIGVEKVADSKFLSLYKIILDKTVVDASGKEKHLEWYMSSRHRDAAELECLTHRQNIDTVCIIPRFTDEEGEVTYVIIDEMRYPVGEHVYSFPAGLIDDGEPKLSAALRELEEETGIQIESKLEPMGEPLYNSEGMTDETVQMFEVDLGKLKLGKQKLQGMEEQIGMHFVRAKDIDEFMKGKKFATKAGMYLMMASRMYAMEKHYKEELAKSQSQPQ